MTHPGTPRDVDLDGWLDGIGFHPADTKAKQVGHQLARELVAAVGVSLHDILPPGRDKTITFTLLEDVLVRANRALALGGGPVDQSDEAVASMERAIAGSPIALPRDHRYEAEQRGEVAEAAVVVEGQSAASWRLVCAIEGVTVYDRPGGVLVQTLTSEPAELEDPGLVEALASYLLRARNEAWKEGVENDGG